MFGDPLKLEIVVKEIHHHRNGIGGAPFYVVSFDAHETDKYGDVWHRDMLAIVFDEEFTVAVLQTKPENGLVTSTWRGDYFEPHLREAIREWQKEQD